LTPPPPRIAALPVDERGYPIPCFVGHNKGVLDFRVANTDHIVACVRKNLCWVCGQKLFEEKVFVIGPMCAINRVSSEPPSHRECAVWSAQNCPFLTKPHMKRREDGMPDWLENNAPGIPLARNPGVSLVWYTKRFDVIHVGRGVLWKLGNPFRWEWFSEGRPAIREEVVRSIESGYHNLTEEAEKEGPAAIAELKRATLEHLRYLPRR
jgi:hypothetical protein